MIAGVGSVTAGFLVGRYNSALVLRYSQVLVLVSILLAGYAPSFAVMLPVLALFGLSVGGADAAPATCRAVALQKRYGARSSSPSTAPGRWARSPARPPPAHRALRRQVLPQPVSGLVIVVIPLLLARPAGCAASATRR